MALWPTDDKSAVSSRNSGLCLANCLDRKTKIWRGSNVANVARFRQGCD